MPVAMNRRNLCKLAVAGAAMPTAVVTGSSSRVEAQAAASPAVNEAFSASKVIDIARALASAPYEAPPTASFDPPASGSPDDSASVRHKPSNLIWASDDLLFVLEPLHRSRSQPNEIELNIVVGDTSSRLTYEPDNADAGKSRPAPNAARLGFSGLRILRRESNGKLRPVANVLNASILSAIARNQVGGSLSRPLTVRSADQVGEEATNIRRVWIEQPSLAATALVMHVLVDTPSLASAIRLILRADDATVIDAECTLFARSQVEHLGITPILASYLSGPMDWPRSSDARPAVYEAGGIQMLTGNGEWLWRPVTNRERLQFSAFVDRDPQGFGLIQRDRSFSSFLDDDNEWQRRPSVWIEPIGKWGAGEVTVMEIPAASQNNKNIVCYWRPKPALAPGSETNFAYRQFWSWRAPSRPDGAIVTVSRLGRIPGDTTDTKIRFLVQFEGERLADAVQASAMNPDLWTSAGKILSIKTNRTPALSSMRVVFELDVAGQSLVELRLLLKQDLVPKSETWLYRWTA